jgi:putative transcriptional regulator
MPIVYKIEVLEALKARGYTTYKLRQEKLLGEGTLQKLRQGVPVNAASLDTLCTLLDCQPGDLLEHVRENQKGQS